MNPSDYVNDYANDSSHLALPHNDEESPPLLTPANIFDQNSYAFQSSLVDYNSFDGIDTLFSSDGPTLAALFEESSLTETILTSIYCHYSH